MDIESCIEAYLEISRSVFGSPRSTTRAGEIINAIFGQSKYKSKVLEQQIKNLVVKILNEEGEDATLLSDKPNATRWYVFVLTTRSINKTKRAQPSFVCVVQSGDRNINRLRSYPSSRCEDAHARIWEAARATSAAPLFFDPIQVGKLGSFFADGAVRCNNPIRELMSEAHNIWGTGTLDIKCILSIGTGHLERGTLGRSALKVVKSCVAIAVETEKTANDFAIENVELVQNGLYFRFNCPLPGHALDEWQRFGELEAATMSYLNQVDNDRKIDQCAKILLDSKIDVRGNTAVASLPARTIRQQTISGPSLRKGSSICVSIPHPRNRRFAARQPILTTIATALCLSDWTVRPEHQRIVVLSGIGGVGKTQIALEFSWSRLQEFSAVLWIAADTKEKIRSGYVQAAQRLGLENPKAPFDMEKSIFLLKAWLDACGKFSLSFKLRY